VNQTVLDRKGIASYLLITFVLTYGIEFVLMAMGTRFDTFYTQNVFIGQVVVMGVMWVPALAAFITARYITGEGFANTGLQFGPVRPYLLWALLMPFIFAMIYAITWALGLHQPDWTLSAFMGMMESAGADLSDAPAPGILIGLIFGASVVTVPFINSIFGFGEEFGWRGYLLPKLMPLGKPTAYVLLGIIWGLWHMPLILMGFTYPGSPLIGTLMFIVLTTLFGVVLNEVMLRYRSSLLAGWLHGLFNSQKLGLWAVLFFGMDAELLGGYQGLVGIGVWGVVAAIMLMRQPVSNQVE
jgi:membrane protease YdiL (CAAX protease family)